MQALIQQKLEELCRQQSVTLLYACESGSRGWQFASPDSGYEVRFIFVRSPDYYLSITEVAEDIALPVSHELDIYGWDIRKVLRLMSKSNTTPFEWLQSPIIYAQQEGFRDALWALCQHCFSPRPHIFHYLGVASSAMASFNSQEPVAIRKLFYMLRPLLAASWCFHRQSIAPMTIDGLLPISAPVLQAEIKALLIQKKSMPDATPVTPGTAISEYISLTYESLRTQAGDTLKTEPELAPLQHFFRDTVCRRAQ